MKFPSWIPFFGSRTSTHDPYDQSNHPNAVLRDIEQDEKVKGLLIDLVKMTQNLTKQDIQSWRSAWQRAIFIQNPRRIELLRHYRDAMIDNTLSGAIMQRKLAVMQRVFKIVDTKTGKEDEVKTKLFKKRWFRQFMNLVLDKPYYGHLLIQLGDVIREPIYRFKEVKLVPPEHVIPEYNVIVKFQEDIWQSGIDYTQQPFTDWCIPVGDREDLGLLLKACPQTISIRHMEAFWDQFGELFGMPLRIGKTTSRDKKERDKIASMLAKMGSAAWGLFPDGTDIEIKETTRGDAYNVYDKRIERAENRLTYLILTESMTVKNGSSHSQSETHSDMFDMVVQSDALMLAEVVNEDLFPIMRRHGFPLGEDDEFQWDDSKQYSPEELAQLIGVLAQHYDVDIDYINNKIQIPVKAKLNKAVAGNPDPANFFD